MEGFRYLSRGLLISIGGIQKSIQGFWITLEGFWYNFKGFKIPQEGVRYPSRGIYLNLSSAIIIPLDGYLNPSGRMWIILCKDLKCKKRFIFENEFPPVELKSYYDLFWLVLSTLKMQDVTIMPKRDKDSYIRLNICQKDGMFNTFKTSTNMYNYSFF